MAKKWLLEEEKYVVDNWGKIGVNGIAHMLERTENSIIRKAGRLGLDINKYSKQNVKKKWNAEEDDVIVQFYQSLDKEIIISMLPSRTWEAIKKRAKYLGMSDRNRRWTKEEEEFLIENWGVLQIETIGSKLNRTKDSVLLKANKIGLRQQVSANGSFLTPKEIAEILMVGTKTVYTWLEKDILGYKKLKINRLRKYQISIDNFKKFLKEYKDRWNAEISDIQFIKSCFTSYYINSKGELLIEIPEWLKEKIDSDNGTVEYQRTIWTTREEEKLAMLMNSGKKHMEIAKQLNRSLFSVENKIYAKKRRQQVSI